MRDLHRASWPMAKYVNTLVRQRCKIDAAFVLLVKFKLNHITLLTLLSDICNPGSHKPGCRSFIITIIIMIIIMIFLILFYMMMKHGSILQPPHSVEQLYMLNSSVGWWVFPSGSVVDVLTDFLDVLVFIGDTSRSDTDAALTNVGTAGSCFKAIREKVGDASELLSVSDLFPLRSYDWNSHILSHGKTCKTAVRNSIWELEVTKKGGYLKTWPDPTNWARRKVTK